MMWAFLTGLCFPFLKHLVSLWQDHVDREHELAMMKLQLENQKQIDLQDNVEYLQTAQIKEDQSYAAQAFKAVETPTGIRWVDAYRSAVRPTIAYAIVLLYFVYVLVCTMGWSQYTDIWTDTDYDVMMLVVGFYFGDRAVERRR